MTQTQVIAGGLVVIGLLWCVSLVLVKRWVEKVSSLVDAAPLIYQALERQATFVARAEYERHLAESDEAIDAVERKVSDLAAQLRGIHTSQLEQYRWEAAQAGARKRVEELDERLRRLEEVEPSKRERT